MEKYAKAQMEVIELRPRMSSRPAVDAPSKATAPVLAQTTRTTPVKVFDLLQQAGRFGGLPRLIFLALQRALT